MRMHEAILSIVSFAVVLGMAPAARAERPAGRAFAHVPRASQAGEEQGGSVAAGLSGRRADALCRRPTRGRQPLQVPAPTPRSAVEKLSGANGASAPEATPEPWSRYAAAHPAEPRVTPRTTNALPPAARAAGVSGRFCRRARRATRRGPHGLRRGWSRSTSRGAPGDRDEG